MVLPLNAQQTEAHERITATLARCFTITRPTDQKTFSWTDHDRPIDLATIGRFSPTPGIRVAASRVGINADPRSTSLSGPVVDDNAVGLTFEDIRLRLWNRSLVTEYVADWRNPHIGPLRTSRYVAGAPSPAERTWEVQLESLSGFLNAKRGEVYGPRCRNVLGGAICNQNGRIFTGPPQAVVGALSSVTDRATMTIAGPGLVSVPATYYALGTLIFSGSGGLVDIEGVRANIQASEAAAGASPNVTIQITLYNALPKLPPVGAPVIMLAGCDKSRPTCRFKFNNFDNFRATPDIIGSDRMFRGANAS